MKHFANARFWKCYRALPVEIQTLADRNYALLRSNQSHGSLHFKQIGALWAVRVGLHYRALATSAGDDLVWFWVGSHAEYDRLVGRKPSRAPVKGKARRGARAARG